MAKYWWVNHSQTFKQEIGGSYLWSPKTEANGSRSQFYDNMRLAAPNDLVVSFANSEISYIGRVSEFALSAPKPSEFGTIGANWGVDGWLLPVIWRRIHQPARPKALLEQLAGILPSKYSPINPRTGNGNQKAYLAEVSREVFQIVTQGLGDRIAPPEDNEGFNYSHLVNALEGQMQAQIEQDSSLSSTEKEQLIKARKGQGVFRKNVRAIEDSCRITGISNQRLLVASHIKPWRSCTSSQERLDGHNGLLLTPNADFLFDRGLISFSDSGHILVSSEMEQSDLKRLGVKIEQISPARAFVEKQREYLQIHRSTVFIS